MPSIPQRADDLSAGWCTEVLAHAGYRCEIGSVTLSPVGTGQMADSLRAHFSYVSRADGAPDTMVVKMTAADESSHMAGARGAYEREVKWYLELDESAKIATPGVYFAAIDPDTSCFVLALEDLHPAEQGDQIAGCTLDEAERALDNLVGLHATSWCRAELRSLEWLHPTADLEARRAGMIQLFTHSTAGFLERYDAHLDPAQAKLIGWFLERFATWSTQDHERFALTHGDYRLDNLLFAPSPARDVWAVDWQTLQVRNPLTDVAYLLGTCLASDDRASNEERLVGGYHDKLVAAGVNNYSREQCFADYRTQSLYSLTIIILGSMLAKQTPRGDEMFMAMLDRASRQIFDLDAQATLP